MMSDWSGFTEEELQRLKLENAPNLQRDINKKKKINTKSSNALHEAKKRSIPQWPKQIDNPVNSIDFSLVDSKPVEDIKLIQSVEVKESPTLHECDIKANKVKSLIKENQNEAVQNESNAKVITEEKIIKENDDIGVLTQEQAVELERKKIEQLQIQHKLIEDQNKKKKMLIASTLQERMKQTMSESQRLKEVQQQLIHLDEKLQIDVESLRNKIEEASLLFSQAEKRYERSESEYVSAKCDYYKKKEEKEQLIEQLYAIIQANEERKAKKLEELMVKLVSNTNLESPTCNLPKTSISNESNTNGIT
ncbi:RAB6-interacting golgin isoform X2 [Hydra vulgaris]|uniref:RAB6-interacting golgin n=1 Tax=Hydra vulgaris TaxID=6087 RepID=A0ABM4CGP2_HYDVU